MINTPETQLKKLTNIISKTQICGDFYIGAIKVLNKTYLPIWNGENETAYSERVASTSFANMYAPVVDGLTGLVTKKEPIAKGFDNIDLKNIDLKHNDLASFIKRTIQKSITNGISFVSAETNTTLNRAYLKRYDYKNLYSYKEQNGFLTQIVFKDTIEVADGEFGLMEQERYIVFKIGGGEIWYADADGKDTAVKKQSEWVNTLKEIPIVPVITGKILTPFEIVPKLLDIAILNKVHLNLESNLSNVLGIVGNPVPMFFGTFTEDKVVFGVKDALLFTDKKTEGAEYLEIKGTSIGEIQKKINLTETQIDKLTYSMLINEDSKTVIDAQQKQSKSTSFLSDIAYESEIKFTKALEFIVLLENKALPKDASLEVQKDFDKTIIDLDIAFKTLQAGDMSRETFYTILKTGVLPKDFNAEDENSKIESDVTG
jgi:hypothetical protein